MGRRSSRPPAPDPNIGLAAQANIELARTQRDIGERQLALQERQMAAAEAQEAERRQQIAEAMELYRGNIAKQNEMTDLAMEQARLARADYESIYRPIEHRLAADAAAAGGAGVQEEMAGRAGADVQRQIDMQREAQEQQLGQMGVNPASGRFEALSRSDAIRGAAARAGAMTGARAQEQARGDMLRAQVAGFGRGVASHALGAGGQAVDMTGATTRDVGAGVGTMAAGHAARMGAFEQGMSGLGRAADTMGGAAGTNIGAAGILQRQHEGQMQEWQRRQAARGGALRSIARVAGAIAPFFGPVGMAVGAGLSALGSQGGRS